MSLNFGVNNDIFVVYLHNTASFTYLFHNYLIGTGEAEAAAVHSALEDWNLTDQVNADGI